MNLLSDSRGTEACILHLQQAISLERCITGLNQDQASSGSDRTTLAHPYGCYLHHRRLDPSSRMAPHQQPSCVSVPESYNSEASNPWAEPPVSTELDGVSAMRCCAKSTFPPTTRRTLDSDCQTFEPVITIPITTDGSVK